MPTKNLKCPSLFQEKLDDSSVYVKIIEDVKSKLIEETSFYITSKVEDLERYLRCTYSKNFSILIKANVINKKWDKNYHEKLLVAEEVCKRTKSEILELLVSYGVKNIYMLQDCIYDLEDLGYQNLAEIEEKLIIMKNFGMLKKNVKQKSLKILKLLVLEILIKFGTCGKKLG